MLQNQKSPPIDVTVFAAQRIEHPTLERDRFYPNPAQQLMKALFLQRLGGAKDDGEKVRETLIIQKLSSTTGPIFGWALTCRGGLSNSTAKRSNLNIVSISVESGSGLAADMLNGLKGVVEFSFNEVTET